MLFLYKFKDVSDIDPSIISHPASNNVQSYSSSLYIPHHLLHSNLCYPHWACCSGRKTLLLSSSSTIYIVSFLFILTKSKIIIIRGLVFCFEQDVITGKNLETAAGKDGSLKTDLTSDIDVISTNPNADIDYIYSANP